MNVIKAVLIGTGVGIVAYFVKSAKMEEHMNDKDKFAKEIIKEIKKIASDESEVLAAINQAIDITQIIDDYAESVRGHSNYAKAIAEMAVKRARK